MTAALRAIAIAALALGACTRASPPSGPVPLAIFPSQGTGLAPLAVTIAGNHFDAAATTDFAGGRSALDAGYRARLLPESGGAAIDLEAVALTPDRRLQATVPAGLALGGYALEVTDPAGRVGRLAQAFRVVIPSERVVAFRVEPLEAAYAAVPFQVAITALDAGGAVVDGFTGSVHLSDATGTLAPTVAGPFVLGTAQVGLTVAAPAGTDRITAADVLGHTGTSVAFAVAAGPPVAVVFTSAPASVAAGACATATVELRDARGFTAAAASPIGIELQSAPAGAVAFHAGAGACNSPVTSVTIAAGASVASFRLVAATAGAVAFRLAPSSLPSLTQAVTVTP